MLPLHARTVATSGAQRLSSASRGQRAPSAPVNNPCIHRFRSSSTRCRFRPSQQSTADVPSSSVKLAKEELQSLEAVIQANSIPTNATDSTTVAVDQVPASVVHQMLQVISKGKEKQAEDLQQLEGFMLLAEQLHRQQGQSQGALPSSSPQKVDVWQPIFASSGGFPRLLYIPVPEYFDMHKAFPDATAISYSSAGSIDISSAGPYAPGSLNIITELGPFTTHFLGSCRWLREDAFAYSINKIRIDFGGRSLTIPMPFKLENELDFFLVTDELACARSKLGGTMLLEANPSKGMKYFGSW